MNSKLIILSILILIVSYACKKEIEIDIEKVPQKLVVMGHASIDQPMGVSVSLSQSILTNMEAATYPDVQVALYKEGQLIEYFQKKEDSIYNGFNLLPFNYIEYDKIYLGSYAFPDEGGEYRMVVKSSEPSLEATTTFRVPEKVNIISLDTTTRMVDEGEYNKYKLLKGKILFKDPPGIRNYYMVSISNKTISDSIRYIYENTDTLMVYYLDSLDIGVILKDFNTREPVVEFYNTWGELQSKENSEPFNNNDNSEIWGTAMYFSDDFFDGQEYSFNFETILYYISTNNYNPSTPEEAFYYRKYKNSVHLVQLPEDVYLYFKSLVLYNEVNGNPFAEKVRVHSNITNGYGVVGVTRTSTVSWEMLEKVY